MPAWLSSSSRYYRWPSIVAALRETPDEWRRMLPNAPLSVVKVVRLRRSPALRLDDGVIEVAAMFPHKGDDGRHRGDIWLRYVPTHPPTDQKEELNG